MIWGLNGVEKGAMEVSGPPSDAEFRSASFWMGPGPVEATFASKIRKIKEVVILENPGNPGNRGFGLEWGRGGSYGGVRTTILHGISVRIQWN